MLTIGLVLSQPPAYSETFFNAKIKGLQENGYRVQVFVQTHSNRELPFQVIVAPKVYQSKIKQFLASIVVGFKLLKSLKNLISFIKLEKQANRSWLEIYKNSYTNAHLLTAQLDWLHFGFTTLAINSEHVAKAIDSKMAVSLRGFDIDVYPLKHQDCYKLVWKQVDKVHAISNYLLQRAYQLGLSKEVAVQKITPAINMVNFNWQPEKEFSNKIQVLTVARLHWIKGLTETLEALAILKQKGIEFKYKIIGTGALYESLSFTIHQLDLKGSVYLVGQKSHQDVLMELSNTEFYIQYSHSEGFCNAVLEAQAAGALCVVSDGGGLPENIIDNQTGWVVPKRQPKLLAESLLKVLELSNQNKQKVREQARFQMESYFTLNQQQIAFKKFYEKN